jgi:hypothetical protein
LKSREHVVYLHHLIGGPYDGDVIPASHRYYKLTMGQSEAALDTNVAVVYDALPGDPEPCDQGNVEALNCMDEHMEFVWLKVRMKYRSAKCSDS